MIKEKIYKNGAILLFNKRKRKCVTVNAGFIFGKNRDNYPEPAAHFCEHMFFKETETKNEDVLKENMQKTFSQKYNGYTNLFYTFIDFCRSTKALEACFELASDMLLNTKFSENLVNSEKGVIKQELIRKLSADGAIFGSACLRTVRTSYTADTKVLGSKEEIEAITPEILKKFRDDTFISQNFVVTIKGGISFWKAKRLTQKHFISKLKSNPSFPVDKTLILPFEREGNLTIEHFEKEKTLCNIAIKLPQELDSTKAKQSANMLCRIANDYAKGKIFTTLRDKGLVYSAQIDFDPMPGQNLLIVYFECSSENVNKVINELGEIFHDLTKNLTDLSMIENIKRNVKLAEDERTPRHIYPDNRFFFSYLTEPKENFTKKHFKKCKKIFNKLTPGDIQDFCNQAFSHPENLYVTILTNASTENFYTYEQMQKILINK